MPAAFRIRGFAGIAPMVAARLLQDNMAQKATNVQITSGELNPLGSISLASAPTKTMPPQTMFLARNGLEAAQWFTWPNDVDVVRAPLDVEVESRFCWTGDGVPKMATYTKAITSGTNNYPSNYWALGIPAPLTEPTVSPSGGVGSATSRLYCYTFMSELNEESAPSPASAVVTGKDDDTWAISNMDAVPPNSGNISDITYSGSEVTVESAVTHFNRVGDEITVANVTTVTNVNGTWTLTAVDTAAKTMTFTVTSAPSGTYVDGTDTTDTWTRTVEWHTANMKRRLYRSAGTNATFQLVDDDVSTSYNDTLSDAEIMGDELISQTWLPPPVGLTALAVHPSGALIGLSGNLFCASEPNQPHAWPPEYQLSMDYDGVGLGVFGQEVAVITKGVPYIVSGTDPLTMSRERLNAPYPGLAKRGIVSTGDGVLYPTTHGMVFIGNSGLDLFTKNHYTEREWARLAPSSMFAEFANGIVYVGYVDVDGTPGILHFRSGELTTIEIEVSDIYADPATGTVYVGTDAGVSFWDEDQSNPLTMTWRSKEFTLATPVNFGVAKVEFEQVMSDDDIAAMVAAYAAAVAANTALLATGEIGGSLIEDELNVVEINGDNLVEVPPQAPDNTVSFTLYKGERVIYSRTISTEQPFRLPAGLKYDHFSVEIVTQNRVRAILIGETITSLKTV